MATFYLQSVTDIRTAEQQEIRTRELREFILRAIFGRNKIEMAGHATFGDRFKHAWALFFDDKLSEARAAASELLREPHLGPFHHAGMRLIMGMSPSTHMLHMQEACHLYVDKGPGRMSDDEKKEIQWLIAHAGKVIESWLDHEIQKKLDSGWTVEKLHDLEKKAWKKYVRGEKIPGVVYEDEGPLPGTIDYKSKNS